MRPLLLFTIFVISTCGLIYELVAGTLASYLLGDSVTQFSTIIGFYLFSMGIGSYLSRFIRKDLPAFFIRIELLTGLIGGISSAVLFICFGYGMHFSLMLYLLILITGLCVGMEIPLIMRILRHRVGFRDLVAQVFTFDYIGALLASIAFPLLLVPYLNLTRTSALFGMCNVGLALYLVYYFRNEIRRPSALYIQGVLVALILVGTFLFAGKIARLSETAIYNEHIIYATNSHYQRIVLTRERNAISLYLNNHLQFNSSDEYRYHEALVHPVLTHVRRCEKVLVLGGGDGLAVREILKYPSIRKVTLVDLDPKLTGLFKNNPVLTALNNRSFHNPKVHVIHSDAFEWIKQNREQYDAIIIDFPDPSNYAVGKLYTLTFYRYLQQCMHSETIGVIQSTSPLYAKASFRCIQNTVNAAMLETIPYHTYVPSFGEWGYVLFGQDLHHGFKVRRQLKGWLYYSEQEFMGMQQFPPDMQSHTDAVQRLDDQVLISLFEKEWDDLTAY